MLQLLVEAYSRLRALIEVHFLCFKTPHSISLPWLTSAFQVPRCWRACLPPSSTWADHHRLLDQSQAFRSSKEIGTTSTHTSGPTPIRYIFAIYNSFETLISKEDLLLRTTICLGTKHLCVLLKLGLTIHNWKGNQAQFWSIGASYLFPMGSVLCKINQIF